MGNNVDYQNAVEEIRSVISEQVENLARDMIDDEIKKLKTHIAQQMNPHIVELISSNLPELLGKIFNTFDVKFDAHQVVVRFDIEKLRSAENLDGK